MTVGVRSGRSRHLKSPVSERSAHGGSDEIAPRQGATGRGLVVPCETSERSGASESGAGGPAAPTARCRTHRSHEEGEITVLKRFCEEDTSDNENSTCNGRIEEAEGETVTFIVFDENDTHYGVAIRN